MKIKNKIISVLLATLIVLSANGCSSNAETTQEQTIKFETHKINSSYSILVDRQTGVCYLEYKESNMGGFAYYGITVMLNADGTPKIWEEN